MAPARGESCLSGQRRGPAAPEDDSVSSPDEKHFNICTTPTTRGLKRRSSGSILPRRVWKRQPHWVIADWLGLSTPARGESCPSGQRRGPAAPGDDNFPSPGHESFHIYTIPTTWGRQRVSLGSILPRTMWKPQPHWLVADWLGLMEPAGGEGCPSGQGRGCAAHGEVKVPSPDHKLSLIHI